MTHALLCRHTPTHVLLFSVQVSGQTSFQAALSLESAQVTLSLGPVCGSGKGVGQGSLAAKRGAQVLGSIPLLQLVPSVCLW